MSFFTRFGLPRISLSSRLNVAVKAGARLGLCAALLVAPVGMTWTFADDETDEAAAQEPMTEILRVRRAWERDNQQVLAAFKPIVVQAPNGTVEITNGEKRIALGTVVSADGQILTKASLLSGQPTVQLPSGQSLEARVLGIDLAEDLALIKVDTQDLQPVQWREGSIPDLGAWVISTDTSQRVRGIGVVSVASRNIPKERGALGIRMDPDAEGVVIASYSGENTPAERAGIRVGDRIAEVNDEPVNSMADLQNSISQFSPGDAVILTVERDGNTQAIQVVLDNLALIDPNIRQREQQETLGADLSLVRTGFTQAFQHDTPLKPLDCGGPVLDLEGKVIGINIARAGRVASYALPATLVLERLALLQSGELSPEKVFAGRITRLGEALTRMATRVNEELVPKLSEVETELQSLQETEKTEAAALAEAQEKLNSMREQIDSLSTSRQELDARIQLLRQKTQEYEQQIQLLQRGLQPR